MFGVVIVDMGICYYYQLAKIGRVGEDFLIVSYVSIEINFFGGSVNFFGGKAVEDGFIF